MTNLVNNVSGSVKYTAWKLIYYFCTFFWRRFQTNQAWHFFPLHILSISNTNLALGLHWTSVRAWVNLNVWLCGCNLAADPVIRQALQSPAAGHSSHFTGRLYSPGWFLLRDTTWLLSEASVPGTNARLCTSTLATHILKPHIKLWASPRLNRNKKKEILSKLVKQRL